MKKLYPLLSVLFLISFGFSQQEYNFNDLVEMDNGLWTEKFSDEPISGKVYGYFGEVEPYKKVYIGNIRNGKKEGKWVSYYHTTGRKKSEYYYKNGKQDGVWKVAVGTTEIQPNNRVVAVCSSQNLNRVRQLFN